MPHEVRMPQLGMTQDTGVIVSWLRASGDAVAEGDALFEVETDKATMEVEAQAAGFLAGIRAAEGDDVPVGDVIALIVESQGDVAEHAAATEAEAPDQVRGSAAQVEETLGIEAPPATEPAPAPEPGPPASAPAGGRILASPKAKRLALEKGIDLATLKAQGVKEPIHAADLSRATPGGRSVLTAAVPGRALDALLASSDHANRTDLFAAFAKGAWGAQFRADIGVVLRHLDGTTTLSADKPAALALVDLCDTRLTGYASAVAETTLATARQGDGYILTLSFQEAALPMAQAAALLDDIAARVEDPIRQLL